MKLKHSMVFSNVKYYLSGINLILIVLAVNLAIACRPTSSSQINAVVGLESDIRDGKSPTFAALGNWYQQFKINFESQGSGANSTNQIDAVSLKNALDPEAKSYLIAWINDQNARLRSFREAIDRKDPDAIRSLLDAEAWEMHEIAAAFLFPTYIPKNPGQPDRLAMLIRVVAAKGLKTDLFAESFLSEVMVRDLKSIYDHLDQERINYAAAMRALYLGQGEDGIQKLVGVINRSQTGLNALLDVLNGNAQFGFGLTYGSPKPLSGSAGLLGQLMTVMSGAGDQRYGTYSNWQNGSVRKPQLSIFQGKDTSTPRSAQNFDQPSGQTISPNVFVPPRSSIGVGGTTMNVNNPVNSGTGGLFPLIRLLLGGGMSLAQTHANDQVPLSQDLRFPKLNYHCNDGTRSGIALVRCQRYRAFLPPAHELIGHMRKEIMHLGGGLGDKNSDSAAGGKEFSLVGQGYNIDGPAHYYSAVQEQKGPSCTAYGLTHTVIRNAMQELNEVNHDAQWASAEKLWQQQDQVTMMETSLSVAQRMSYRSPGGKSFQVSRANELRSAAEMKAVIDQGRAVYAGSNTGSSWDDAFSSVRGATMACDGQGYNGHAYSIQGYDDSKQVWIVKNSWGDSWGESGYGYLPYRCFDLSDYNTVAYDVEVQGY